MTGERQHAEVESTSVANCLQTRRFERICRILDKNEQATLRRLSMGQKVVLNRYQTNVHTSQMDHARRYGDKNLENQLRLNWKDGLTRLRDMEKSDKTLISLWREGEEKIRSRRRKEKLCRELGLEEPTPGEKLRPGMSKRFRSKSVVSFRRSTNATIEVDRRPFTSILRRGSTQQHNRAATAKTTTKSVRIETTKPEADNWSRYRFLLDVEEFDPVTHFQTSTPDLDSKDSEAKEKGKTGSGKVVAKRTESSLSILSVSSGNSLGSSDDSDEENPVSRQNRDRKSSSSSPRKSSRATSGFFSQTGSRATSSTPSPRRSKKRQFSLFPEENTDQPSLLEIHKERVQSANFRKQIDNLVENMQKYKMADVHVVRDYHYDINRSLAAQSSVTRWRPPEGAAVEPDLKRYTGDLTIKNLTCPKLVMSGGDPGDGDTSISDRKMPPLVPHTGWK